MEATLLVRRRSNSTLAVKAPGRSRCHSVHIAALRQGNEENRKRVSTFSVRSRASSMSSFSSGSSGCSTSLSSLASGYNTETFWNRYRRAPDTSIVTNFFRKYKLIKLVNREDRAENKYHSAADLLNYNWHEINYDCYYYNHYYYRVGVKNEFYVFQDVLDLLERKNEKF